jgi:hypothetical protein
MCLGLGAMIWPNVGWYCVVPCYAGVSFLLLAVAYASVGSRLLLKRSDGTLSSFSWLLYAPYFLLNAFTFNLYRVLSREPAFVEVAPNLFLGRRLSSRESQKAGFRRILDLACEFAESQVLRSQAGYCSLPVLDTEAPTELELRSAVAWIADAVKTEAVYVHCALGHGRSACVVIAYLLATNVVKTVSEGQQFLRKSRPGVRLHASQRDALRSFESPK